MKLVAKAGDEYRAKGMVVSAWEIAQFWYLKSPHGTIPKSEWDKFDAGSLIVEVGLARMTDSGVYVCGSHEQFSWLRRASRGGKAGRAKQLGFSPDLSPSTPQESGTSLLSSHNSNYKEKNKEQLLLSSGDDAHPLLKIWNLNRGKLPGAKGMSSKRRAAANARWKEKPSTEYWTEVVQRMARSSFCQGGGQHGWKASFDFLLQPETHNKTLEGKYDDPGASPEQTARLAEIDAYMRESFEGA